MNLQSKYLKSRSKKEQLIDNDINELANEIISVSAIIPADASSLSYDGTTSGLAATDVQAAIDEVQANIDALPAAPTTTVVNISSAQILAMGTTPIELLPAPGAGKYYEWSIRFEFDYGTVPYSIIADLIVVGCKDDYSASIVHSSAIVTTENTTFSCSSDAKFGETSTSVVFSYPLKMNKGVYLFTYNGTDPTLGDGTMRAIITYNLRTFGA